MKADLHVHTDISDGSYDLKQTISIAKANGVSHLAITNHDTIKGIDVAIVEGKKQGITIIPGIEISACDVLSGKKIHILGYCYDLLGENIKKLCDPILERRKANSLWQVELLIKKKFKIDLEKVQQRAKNSGIIYKQHIMAELIPENYMDEKYKMLYKEIFKGMGMCSRDIEYVSMIEAVKAIRADNGLAVLAHPGQLDSYEFIEELVEAGLDGIELNHNDHTDEDHSKIMEYASKYGLILTGGSDFHGKYGQAVNIGDEECPTEYNYIFKENYKLINNKISKLM
ncbi:PHP domain-containing protein [Clostridium lacusfryxellense]|uniref:PHP domain-containing protein n=1 Tax=Clostridium lacusfryxellense TaxID=205328 RepID=UPI001C0B5E01|nr:PHP domain-containing protein [Clostridium lacusfryxellense]MBU3112527.1 PHP domain-containing protein [Clostridium lacusfryxellense]